MSERRSFGFNTQNTIIGIAVMLIGMLILFWLAKSIFNILAFVAPILLIVTLVINHRVVVNYGKWVFNLLKTNTLMGIVAVILTIVGFPVVSFLLFGKALLQRKVNEMTGGMFEEEKYIEYEEVDEEIEESLELPPLEQQRPSTDNSDYEALFD